MSINRLNIISTENNRASKTPEIRPKTNREEIKSKYEFLWESHPQMFDPSRNYMEKIRIERSYALLLKHSLVQNKLKAVDLGSGSGVFSKLLCDAGVQVTAVDVAGQALNAVYKLCGENIERVQDTLPSTKILDDQYDLVISLDLIAHLREREHRLFINELARIVNPKGSILCSTAIDIYSEDALERFFSLIDTELELIDYNLSYHRLFISLKHIFGAAERFVKAANEPAFRAECLNCRSYFAKGWFSLNSSKWMRPLWSMVQNLTKPIVSFMNSSPKLLIVLEKLSRALWKDAGISHIIILAKRRALFEPD